MTEYRRMCHTVYDIKYHIVWTTKYRYKILNRHIGTRLKTLIQQGCAAKNVNILGGNVGCDHVHILISCPTNLAPSKIVQYLKGRSSHLLQDEFPELRKRYWGQHMWSRGYFCATIGDVDEEIIKRYIEEQGAEYNNDNFKVTA